MATKPTTDLRWATGNPTDPTSGQPAIIAPAGSKIVSGFDRLEKPPRQDLNFLHNLAGQWNEWFEQETDANTLAIADHIADPAGAHAASAISNDSAVPGVDVAGALDVLDGDITAHVSDATDAHADTAIDNTSGVAGANVKEALDTLDAGIAGLPIQAAGLTTPTWVSNASTQDASASATFTITGAAVGDVVIVTMDNRLSVGSSAAGATLEGEVTALNTVRIIAINASNTSPITFGDLNSGVYTVTVFPV